MSPTAEPPLVAGKQGVDGGLIALTGAPYQVDRRLGGAGEVRFGSGAGAGCAGVHGGPAASGGGGRAHHTAKDGERRCEFRGGHEGLPQGYEEVNASRLPIERVFDCWTKGVDSLRSVSRRTDRDRALS
jgi:hypothetical protein